MTLWPTSIESAVFWMEHLIALAVFLQTLELLGLRRIYAAGGVWDWTILSKDFRVFPSPLPTFFGAVLNGHSFTYLLLLRALASTLVFVWPHPIWIPVLFITSLLTCMRWRGTFNGGSDYMTLLILWVLTFTSALPSMSAVFVGYAAIQTCLSYFIAGLTKIRNPNWRNGTALKRFLISSNYDVPSAVKGLVTRNPQLFFLGSWGVIIFENSFPLALLNPHFCGAYISAAFLFHIANVYIFGLNRFLFAWVAAYPALFWLSHSKW